MEKHGNIWYGSIQVSMSNDITKTPHHFYKINDIKLMQLDICS